MMQRSLALALLLTTACASATGGIEGADPADFEGSWAGTWVNTTFDSSGTATMDVTVDEAAGTASVTLDLNGNVFGGLDPDPVTLDGTFDETGVDVSGDTGILGMFSLSWALDGTISGSSEPDGFAEVALEGMGSPSAIDLTYTIYDEPGSVFAEGTFDLAQ